MPEHETSTRGKSGEFVLYSPSRLILVAVDPPLEILGLRLSARRDNAVDAGLGNYSHFLGAAKGVDNNAKYGPDIEARRASSIERNALHTKVGWRL